MTDQVEVKGLKELRYALAQLPQAVQGKALQSALAAGARPIEDSAIARAPRGKTGRLARAIYSTRDKLASNLVRESRIITVRSGKRVHSVKGGGLFSSLRDAFYWKFIEFGRGTVTKKGKGSLGTPQSGFFGKRVQAYPAHPFMRPAFQSEKFVALELIRQKLARNILAAGKRLYRKALK